MSVRFKPLPRKRELAFDPLAPGFPEVADLPELRSFQVVGGPAESVQGVKTETDSHRLG